nr:uncharacterized protein LOC129438601 isoform X2 [Misgurnus anguillicaudatus]
MFAVSASGVVLLFLLHHTTPNTVNGQNIDSNTLASIFTFFEENYKRVENGSERQSALAINVPMKQCQAGFKPSNANFLTNENPEEVKRNISNKKDPIYEGRPTPPMQDLLNKRKDDSCTVFYTLNSPCAGVCLNESSEYNIFQGLQNWIEHDSIKALVFKQIYKDDVNDAQIALKKIVKHIDVYRCIRENNNENVCHACGGRDSDTINEHCLSN